MICMIAFKVRFHAFDLHFVESGQSLNVVTQPTVNGSIMIEIIEFISNMYI